jgi:orotate phosphoribosyltransferase
MSARRASIRRGLRLISQLFYELIQKEDVTAVGGLTLGADPLVSGL